MKLDWKAWLMGLWGALVSGAANAAALILIDPSHFNLHEGLTDLGVAASAGAAIGLIAYLKQSPIPPKWDGKDRRDSDSGT